MIFLLSCCSPCPERTKWERLDILGILFLEKSYWCPLLWPWYAGGFCNNFWIFRNKKYNSLLVYAHLKFVFIPSLKASTFIKWWNSWTRRDLRGSGKAGTRSRWLEASSQPYVQSCQTWGLKSAAVGVLTPWEWANTASQGPSPCKSWLFIRTPSL